MTVGAIHRRFRGRLTILGVVILGAVFVPAVLPGSVASAGGGGGVITSFTDPSIDTPTGITTGPDSALWFTNEGNNSIGRITTSGVVASYTATGINEPGSITLGPDAALWFTNFGTCDSGESPCDPGSIGRITTGGVVTIYTDSTIFEPDSITTGPDGALWFTNQSPTGDCSPYCGSIGRISTSGVVSNFTSTVPRAIDGPGGITAGPDDSLWFTNSNTDTISRITTKGTITVFLDTGVHPVWITAGPDGDLWSTNDTGGTEDDAISRITSSGSITNYFGAGASPGGISAGPDGALWYVGYMGTGDEGVISRITTSGTTTTYGPLVGSLFDTAAGPDGNEWFTDIAAESIDRITTNDSVTISPSVGPAGTPVTIAGAGFSAGETVKVKYLTDHGGPKLLLCKTTAALDGTFSCPATIPSDAGSAGTHTIQAKGATSGTVAETLYLRTK